MITRVVCFFWLIAKAISWKAWLSNRFFPIIPPFDFLRIPAPIHLILFIFSVTTLVALLILPQKKGLLLSVILIEVFSCLLDQNRWQPWEYEYIFFMVALVINNKNEKNAIAVIAFIITSVYFFSGIHKMNSIFSINAFNLIKYAGILPPISGRIPDLIFYHLGYILGLTEVLLAIGLLVRKYKKVAAIFLIIMHILIIILVSPLGINYDTIIIPWNIAFILILYIIFISKPIIPTLLETLIQKPNLLFLILFGALPVLNFFGYWDFFLSANLFSFKPPEMYIYIQKPGRGIVLKPYFAAYKNKLHSDSNAAEINIMTWSFKELHVPAYPEIRIYKSIKTQLEDRYPDMRATFLVKYYYNGKKKIMKLK